MYRDQYRYTMQAVNDTFDIPLMCIEVPLGSTTTLVFGLTARPHLETIAWFVVRCAGDEVPHALVLRALGDSS